MNLKEKKSFTYLYCAENISNIFESLYGEQSYIEDFLVYGYSIKNKHSTEEIQIPLQSIDTNR